MTYSLLPLSLCLPKDILLPTISEARSSPYRPDRLGQTGDGGRDGECC